MDNGEWGVVGIGHHRQKDVLSKICPRIILFYAGHNLFCLPLAEHQVHHMVLCSSCCQRLPLICRSSDYSLMSAVQNKYTQHIISIWLKYWTIDMSSDVGLQESFKRSTHPLIHIFLLDVEVTWSSRSLRKLASCLPRSLDYINTLANLLDSSR
jgi:hypothetical protein